MDDPFCKSCAEQRWKPPGPLRRADTHEYGSGTSSSHEDLSCWNESESRATYVTEVAFELGTVATVQGNSRTCSRCRFVWKALLTRYDVKADDNGLIAKASGSTAQHQGPCRASDKVGVCFSYRIGPLGRLESWREPFIVSIRGPSGNNSFSLQWTLENSEDSDLGLQSPDSSHPTDRKIVDIKSCQAWVRQCESEHENCRNKMYQGQMIHTESKESNESEVCLDLAFVDVKSRRLVRPRAAVRYLALSYVWGPGPHEYLNFQDLSTDTSSALQSQGVQDDMVVVLPRQPIGLVRSILPRTLSDAIAFTEALGERYIWIDALCIPQDDPMLKLLQIEAMDEVFQGAVCTLIALEGTSSASGLPGSSVRSPRNVVSNVETLAPGVRARMVGEYEDLIEKTPNSPWATRAWTLQEGLYSVRCLIFTTEQVYFRCMEASASESSKEFTSTTHDRVIYASNTAKLFDRYATETNDFSYFYTVYGQLISLYTSRTMTYADDALAAMKGIFRGITNVQGTQFFHGLPLRYFGLALLWEETTGTDKNSTWPRKPHRWEQVPWPTWTWVAHWTAVTYNEWGGLKNEPPKKIQKPNFAIIRGEIMEPLNVFVKNAYSQSGRRGISHTKLGTSCLHIAAMALRTSLKDWHPEKNRERSYTNRWSYGSLRFDSRHRGEILSASSLSEELYLVATWTKKRYYGTCQGDPPYVHYSALLKVLLVEVRGIHSRRIGTAVVDRAEFADKSALKEFLME